MSVARIIKNLTVIITFIGVFLPNLAFTPIHAQTPTLQQNYDQVCKDKFNNDPKYNQFYKDLQDAQAYDRNNPQPENKANQTSDILQAGCPPSFDDISIIVLRLITILITVVGVIVFFNLVKGAVLMMTAGANKDRVKAARGSIQGTIMGLLIIIISYTLIVFIANRLGLSGDSNNFSILDGGRLIFRFLFDY